jgi:hypothetical protein
LRVSRHREVQQAISHLPSCVAVLHILLPLGERAKYPLIDINLMEELVRKVDMQRTYSSLCLDDLPNVKLDDGVVVRCRVKDETGVQK